VRPTPDRAQHADAPRDTAATLASGHHAARQAPHAISRRPTDALPIHEVENRSFTDTRQRRPRAHRISVGNPRRQTTTNTAAPTHILDAVLVGYARVSTADQTPTTRSTRSPAPAATPAGAHPGSTPDQAALAQQLYDAGQHTVGQIADLLGVPRTTIYGHLNDASKGKRAAAHPTPKSPAGASTC
jgi:hypothetical protein